MLDDALQDLSERYAQSLNNLLWSKRHRRSEGTRGNGGVDHRRPDDRHRCRYRPRVEAVVAQSCLHVSNGHRSRRLRLHSLRGAVVRSHRHATGGGALITKLQTEYRQLTRYGGRPNTGFCGSDLLAAPWKANCERTAITRCKASPAARTSAVGTISYMGTDFEYDPTLDQLGHSKRAYWWDAETFIWSKMDGEWRHQHSPARPPDKYVLYRGITSTGQLCARRLNSAVVMDIA